MSTSTTVKNLFVLPLGLSLLFGACEAAAPADASSNAGSLGRGEVTYPTNCTYGDPVVKAVGQKLIVTCPDGGDGAVIECPVGLRKVKLLDEGHIVAACVGDEAPRLPSPEPPVKVAQ
jgi:hypothetical protein